LDARLAEEKTGKYAMSLLKQLENHLGTHAVLLVAYQDTKGELKVLE
jgi:hypothetical protein